MKKVAVFGNAGGGKSTLSRSLAELTRLPLYPLDMIQYRADGKVPYDDYLKAHAELLQRDAWIIDGFGCRQSAWERFACHRHLTPKYRELVSEARHHKRVHHLRSAAEMDAFLNAIRRDSR